VASKKADEIIAKPKVSHAKKDTPPPPPVWTLDDALENLSDALNNEGELTGIPLFRTWTPEQQGEVEACLKAKAEEGKLLGMEKISELLFKGSWKCRTYSLELLEGRQGFM
jgi:hypothetical protein